jgi:hypothetical protein
MQPMQHMSAFMQQCLVIMHDDAHDQVFVAFNIWDVTLGKLCNQWVEWLTRS